jgi:uncharacterized membrane protein
VPRATEPAAVAGRDGGTLAPAWLQWTTFLLAIAGLGVSAYLTYTHFTDAKILGCAESGTVDCTKVTTSSQSMVFGIFPVALLGLLFYVFAVPLLSPWAWRLRPAAVRPSPSPGPWGLSRLTHNLGTIRLVSLIAGMGFVIYLLYAELFQIDAICLYCTSVHAITFLIFILVVLAAAVWGVRPSEPDT